MSKVGFDEEKPKWRIGWMRSEHDIKKITMPGENTKEYDEMKNIRWIKNGFRTAMEQHYRDDDKYDSISFHVNGVFVSVKDRSVAQQKLRADFISSNAIMHTRVKWGKKNGKMDWLTKGFGKNKGKG